MSTLLVTSWVPEEILLAGKNLKVICNLGVGYDHIDGAYAILRGEKPSNLVNPQ